MLHFIPLVIGLTCGILSAYMLEIHGFWAFLLGFGMSLTGISLRDILSEYRVVRRKRK